MHLCSSPQLSNDDHASISCACRLRLVTIITHAVLKCIPDRRKPRTVQLLPTAPGHMQILEPSNVKRIVEEADGYQPHLIAPEMGYRRLLQECLVLFKGPADTAVGEVHHVLRSIVASTINSEDCKNLQQYTSLKREIVATASSSLGESCATVCSSFR